MIRIQGIPMVAERLQAGEVQSGIAMDPRHIIQGIEPHASMGRSGSTALTALRNAGASRFASPAVRTTISISPEGARRYGSYICASSSFGPCEALMLPPIPTNTQPDNAG